MDAATDPWAVQPRERARYEEQFKSLNPVNGIVTGVQAKGFFCQSQLPVDVLGQIWGLADVDSDGRLDINEFSIACKLITLKLKGFPIPTALPPTLKALVGQSPVVSSQTTPLSHAPPAKPPPPVIPPQPMMAPQPIIPPQSLIQQQPPLIPTQPAYVATQPVQSLVNQQPIMASGYAAQPMMTQPVGIIAQQPMGMMAQPVMTMPQQVMQPLISTQPIPPAAAPVLPRPSLTGLSTIPSGISQPLIDSFAPVAPVVPTSQGTPLDTTRTLDRKSSFDSQSGMTSPGEWGVPQQTKLKYTQLFNTHDRTRTGFLSAMQARNIMVQSKLPQKSLAQIWTLADTDNDGKLSCEEFVLALHLCEMAVEGKPIPAALPVDLIPPSARRRGSVLSQGDDKVDPASLLISSVSFEDKRKENFDKGQAELERRRATLQEQQRKEREERERKEREEEERREKLRREQEARRQAELQEQLQKQMEMEQLQEEQRRRAQEQREAARKEAERQRQQEWEKARTQELETQRQREQENVLKLKARNQTLAIELTSLTGKVKELSSKITETRAGVAAVKATIDGMRTTRDTHMSEMAANKVKLKEQNQRLVLLTQEKAKLEARNKSAGTTDQAAVELTNQAYFNKQNAIKKLNEKLAQLQNEVQSKTDAVEDNNQQLKDLRTQLKNLINSCDTVYENYADKRDQVLQLKAAKSGWGGGGSAASAWGAAPVTDSWGSAPLDAWGAEPAADAWGAPAAQEAWPTADVTSTSPLSSTHLKYRALYEFSSRNPDELSFMPGDTIMVPVDQKAEPGWLMGELQGRKGWFPESYVEPIDGATSAVEPVAVAAPEKLPLDGIPEVPEVEVKPVGGMAEICVAIYPYQSSELGDLSFQQGEIITVIKKEGDWWTGVVGDRSGIFPANYVQPSESQLPPQEAFPVSPPVAAAEPAIAITPAADPGTDSDDVFLQAGESKPGSKSPVSGRDTPADADRVKPATPDFTQITAAQTKLLGKKGEIATVIAPYTATSAEQLSLARGQLVCIRKKTTTGWWEGELQAKGKKKQVGWFPATYVKVMASRRLSQTTPDFEAELNAQKVIAMFPYKALNEDELTFEKDDLITIVSRDDAAWWKGELKGLVGLFPSNYVMPIDNMSPLLGSEDRLRQESIIELVESERAYTNDMANVRLVFEKPLARSGLLTREQLGRIFLNWRDILRENKLLLRLLDERKRNGVYDCVGDILVENIPRMSSYVRFCSCQLSAGALLQELTDHSVAFRELCKQCQRDPRTQGLPLSTFLIKPMQRITKYPLLVSKILELTPRDHPDRPNLERALKCAERLCSQVNEGVREQENSEKLEWLQSHIILDGEEPIVFNSLTKRLGPRKFIRHGCLFKTRSGRELVAFLLSDCLVLAQPMKPLTNGHVKLDKNSNLVFKLYKKPLLLHEMTIDKVADSQERSFVVAFDKGQCNLTAASASEASNWIKALTAAQAKALSATTPVNHTPSEIEQGPAIGRLLIEVVEATDLESRPVVCELQMGNQKQTTAKTLHPFKFHHSMQFIVRNVSVEAVMLCLYVQNEFMPDDILNRTEIKLSEMREHSQSAGPVLRKLSLKHNGKAHLNIKFDLVLFGAY